MKSSSTNDVYTGGSKYIDFVRIIIDLHIWQMRRQWWCYSSFEGKICKNPTIADNTNISKFQ